MAGVGCAHYNSTIDTVLSASSGSLIGPAGEYNFPVQAPYERVIHESKCDGGLRPAIGNYYCLNLSNSCLNDEPKNTVAQCCLNLSKSNRER